MHFLSLMFISLRYANLKYYINRRISKNKDICISFVYQWDARNKRIRTKCNAHGETVANFKLALWCADIWNHFWTSAFVSRMALRDSLFRPHLSLSLCSFLSRSILFSNQPLLRLCANRCARVCIRRGSCPEGVALFNASRHLFFPRAHLRTAKNTGCPNYQRILSCSPNCVVLLFWRLYTRSYDT